MNLRRVAEIYRELAELHKELAEALSEEEAAEKAKPAPKPRRKIRVHPGPLPTGREPSELDVARAKLLLRQRGIVT